MVDGLDDRGGVCRKQLEDLRLTILSHLMATLPCVAIGTLRHGNDGWKESASLVQSKIPVLYIDVRQENRKFWREKIDENITTTKQRDSGERKSSSIKARRSDKNDWSTGLHVGKHELDCGEAAPAHHGNDRLQEEAAALLPTGPPPPFCHATGTPFRPPSTSADRAAGIHGAAAAAAQELAKRRPPAGTSCGPTNKEEPTKNSNDGSKTVGGSERKEAEAAKKLVADAMHHCEFVVWESLKNAERFDILDACRMAFLHSICKQARKFGAASSVSDSQVPMIHNKVISIHHAIEQEQIKKLANQDRSAQVHNPCIPIRAA